MQMLFCRVDIDADGGDNKMNEGNTSGTAVAGTDVVVEVFIAKGWQVRIVGGRSNLTFDTDKLTRSRKCAPAAGLIPWVRRA